MGEKWKSTLNKSGSNCLPVNIDDRTLYFLSDKKHLVEAKEKLANRMYICKT